MADASDPPSGSPLLAHPDEFTDNVQQQKASFSSGFTLLCTAIAALGPLTFGYTLGYTSPALTGLAIDLQLNTAQQSFFSAIVSVGAMAGALSGGSIADFVGRKMSLMAAAISYIIGWTLIAFSHGFLVLCVGRLLCGTATGIVSFAVPVYIAEIAPGALRGSLGSMNQVAITLGILLVYALGLGFPWRVLAIIGVIPPVLLLLGLVIIPESPRWVAKNKTKQELLVVMQKLRGLNSDISAEVEEIEAAIRKAESQSKASLKDLLEPTLRKPLMVGVGLMVLQQFTGVNTVVFFAGKIFEAAGYKDPNVPGFVVVAIQVVITAIAAGVMDQAGRRPMLVLSTSGLALGLFTLGLAFLWEDSSHSFLKAISSPLSLMSLVLYIVAFSIGQGPIPWVIMSEIFPARVRGLAGSMAVLTNWLSCFVVTLTFTSLLSWSNVGAFWLYATECVFTVVFVALVVPETKGKSLEEIEASFRGIS